MFQMWPFIEGSAEGVWERPRKEKRKAARSTRAIETK